MGPVHLNYFGNPKSSSNCEIALGPVDGGFIFFRCVN